MANHTTQTRERFSEGLRSLSPAEKRLLGTILGLAVLALALGGLFALVIALAEASFVDIGVLSSFKFLTLHGATSFYYWLYLVQVGVILSLILVFVDGARLTPVWVKVAWLGLLLILAGWVVNVASPVSGAAVLYSAPEPLTETFKGGGTFLVGYILLALGLILSALTGMVAAVRPKLEGRVKEWSSVAYGAFLWEGLLLTASVISLFAYVPAAQIAFGAEPFIRNFDYTMSWHVLFHNMHYLPLMSAVLVWYVLVEATTGVKSIFSDRFSKGIFSFYLMIVPPTSLYHMFLEPDISGGTKLLGSILGLLISVPTIAIFLVIVASLQACANGKGARGLFGWLRYLPWRNPAFAAVAMATVCAFGGGIVANVLIQERFASLVSDTYTVPGYFHFLTAGTVTLTFIGAMIYMIPTLTRHRLCFPSLAAALPYVMTAGVYVFGVAGVWAGYLGAPREAPGFDYGAGAPASWGTLFTFIGIGAIIMVAAGAAYVVILVATGLRDMRSGRAVEKLPVASFRQADAVGQRVWFGPVAVGVLLAGMYVATAVAFRMMEGLPIVTG